MAVALRQFNPIHNKGAIKFFFLFFFSFCFCLCMCTGAYALSLFCKLRKYIKIFNDILKLPDLCLRLSRSYFYFWSEKRFRFWFTVFDVSYIILAISGLSS